MSEFLVSGDWHRRNQTVMRCVLGVTPAVANHQEASCARLGSSPFP
jgi:hypothetical protein